MATKICAKATPLRSEAVFTRGGCQAGCTAGVVLACEGVFQPHIPFSVLDFHCSRPSLTWTLQCGNTQTAYSHFFEVVDFHYITLKTTCTKVPETKARNRGNHQLHAESSSNL